MAAPNLIALTTVNIKTAIANPTTTMADLIAAVATGHAVNVEAVYVSNIHVSTAGALTLVHKKGGTEYKIANAKRVPTNEMYNFLLGKPLYLEEGDSLRIQAAADDTLTVLAPYSDVT